MREALDRRGSPCALIGALALASARELPDLGLRVVDVPHLVALELKAGGPGDYRDVVELLERVLAEL